MEDESAGPQQMQIDGLEVSMTSTVNLPGAGTVRWKLGSGVDWTPQRGDKFEVVTRYTVEDITYPYKHNKKGVNTAPILEHIVTEVVEPGIAEIIAVVTRQEEQKAWDAQHTSRETADA